MVNKFIFNRKKKNTIVLIHGLYTTSGFWLSYFKLFKNFRIIAFDINYDELLKSDYSINFLRDTFCVDGEIVGIISHSFGTVISDLVFDQNYEISNVKQISILLSSIDVEKLYEITINE